MKTKKPYHKDDLTHKYSAMAFKKRFHKYLGLPGNYYHRYPTEVVLRTMESGRMDELYSTKEGILVNLEEESGDVTEKTLKKLAKYKTFGSFIYAMPMVTAIICKKNPKNFPKEYKISETDILRPLYFYFPQDRLWQYYENVINKINQNIKLSEKEALDIAFIPKYISEKYAENVTRSLAKVFDKSIMPDKELKRDIAVILETMILTNINDETEQIKLMEAMNMDVYRDDMQEIVYSVYGEELNKKDEEIKKMAQDITEKEKSLAEKDKDIAEKDKDIAEKDKDLAEKDKDLAEKDKQINEMKKGFNEKIEEINALKDIPADTKKIINSILLAQK